MFLCCHSHNDVSPEPQRNVSMAAVRGAVRPPMTLSHKVIILLYTGRLFHCYMFDESICHFRGVGSILSLFANNVDSDQMPH